MVSSETNKTMRRGSWKKILLFSFTLLRLMVVPALASSLPAAGAVSDRAYSHISTSFEFWNADGRSLDFQRAGQTR
jgi:hypothetical protein